MQRQSPPHLGWSGWASLGVFWPWLSSQKSHWSPSTPKRERAATVVRRLHPWRQKEDTNAFRAVSQEFKTNIWQIQIRVQILVLLRY